MKMVLTYWVHSDASDYSAAFAAAGEKMDEWLFPIDATEILPKGTLVYLTDKKTGHIIVFEVIGHHYEADENLLQINVMTNVRTEISPEDFVKYIQQNWTTGAKINA